MISSKLAIHSAWFSSKVAETSSKTRAKRSWTDRSGPALAKASSRWSPHSPMAWNIASFISASLEPKW